MAVTINHQTNDISATSGSLTIDGAAVGGGGGGGGTIFDAVSGASQTLDVGSADFFYAGTLTADTTVSFSNVPTEAKWTYTFEGGVVSAYSIDTAFYDNIFFSIASQEVGPTGIFFKPDGTKMYVLGNVSDSVHQYSLSTAWDISTASYDSVSFSVSNQEGSAQDLFFKSDGTKMYIVGFFNKTIYQYTLSSAWDVSSASYDSVGFSVNSQDSTPFGFFIKPDGTKMYVMGATNDAVFQYSLSSAWDMSTASYDTVSFSISSQELNPQTLFFKSDGTKFYVLGYGNDTIFQYSLSTAWDMTTASYDGIAFGVLSQDASPSGLFFKSDGTKFYVLGPSADAVFQYSSVVSTSVTLPASVQNPPKKPYGPNRVTYDFFTSDGGTNVYLIGEGVL